MTEPTPETADRGALELRAAILAALGQAVAEERRIIAAQLEPLMRIGDSSHPKIPDGSERPPDAATVSYKHGPSKIIVTDQDDFLAWVADTYPHEVEVIEQVRPAFMRLFKDANGTLVGPMGELDVPGIEVRQGAPVLAVRVDLANRDQLFAAFANVSMREILGGGSND